MRKLKINNGCYLQDVHNEYNDYTNSGFVKTINERKVTSEIIFKKNEYIADEYVIKTPNIDYSNVYMSIDNYDLYSLINEETGNAQMMQDGDILIDIFDTIDLIRDENNYTILKVKYYKADSPYKVKDKVVIKYNYTSVSNADFVTYKSSDENLMQIDFSDAFFKSKDVTDEIQTIALNDIGFIGTNIGDVSKNYQIANYNAIGKIIKRPINLNIKCLDKIYDGSSIIPFIDNGVDNVIPGDDVYIDAPYEENTDMSYNINENNSTILKCENGDVGTNKFVLIDAFALKGEDAKNYFIEYINCHQYVSIYQRPISIKINKLRLIRATRKWEVDYTIENDIKTDKLTIVYNTDDDLDIKVYGGVDKNNKSIHTNYAGKLDILSMFFNYPFNNNYKFEELGSEIKKVADNKSTAYWTNDSRPAEPDTERIDINVESDISYPGAIKISLDNSVKTAYFESENKEYKLYSGCKVAITNVNLNPLNNKSKNYTITKYETNDVELEIV